METGTGITFTELLALAALMVSLHGLMLQQMRTLRKEMNRRFDEAEARTSQRFADTQADMNQRFADAQQAHAHLQANMNQRFADAQQANDQAHAHIGENIRSLERRVDNGLANVHVQLAAMTPRAMAAPEPPDAAPAADAGGAARP